MRFSLIDLLIFIAVLLASMFGADRLLPTGHEWRSLAMLVCLATLLGSTMMLTIIPLLYRRLRMLPLHLPSCPHCGVMPQGYREVGGEWPHVAVKCSSCDGNLTLVFDRSASAPAPSEKAPVLVLQWPVQMGFWRKLA